MVQYNQDVWIIIPVHNEGAVIAGVVGEILTTFPNVVCVDDGSTDDSSAQIAATGAHLVRHPVNLGQGGALATGLRYALGRADSQFFVTFDADGQHRVEDAATMIDMLRSGVADVVLGSRFLGTSQSVPLVRRVALRAITALSPAARRLRLTDTHNGLRVFSRPPAAALRITQNGMAHASEITAWLARSGWRVAESPVTVLYTAYSRAKGQSLVNGINILFDMSVSQRER